MFQEVLGAGSNRHFYRDHLRVDNEGCLRPVWKLAPASDSPRLREEMAGWTGLEPGRRSFDKSLENADLVEC
jgi:hypothetical protein